MGPFLFLSRLFFFPDKIKTMLILIFSLFFSLAAQSATIAIIDTGFDLDHDFLKPKLMKNETDEEPVKIQGWDPHDNSHLKKAVVEDQGSVQEILLYRNLKAKGHKEGLSIPEFEWYKNKSSDKKFMALVRMFRKHSHGTFVAGIALREGENINIFPIRGLNLPNQIVAVEDSSTAIGTEAPVGKTPEEKFQAEIKNSLSRVSKKFNKICRYISRNDIQIVNASYGITHKNIVTRFREKYRELTGLEIPEAKLNQVVNDYFTELYRRGEKTIRKYPKILFVFSAGNSGLDNDNYHHYPSRIKLPNTMSVAATNGDFLASFSNYGHNVDIGAPGVAILSLVPKVYSGDGNEIYSPSSGTSMAAPHISNLAAQILNTNKALTPSQIKQIILETGDEKLHLKPRLFSGSIVNNNQAIRAALLTRDLALPQAISLGKSNLIQMEDKISIGQGPAITPEGLKKKVLDSVPTMLSADELDDEPEQELLSTKSESSSPMDPKKEQPDNLVPPASAATTDLPISADPSPSSQTATQSQPPSEGQPASSSQSEPIPPPVQNPELLPSSPQ